MLSASHRFHGHGSLRYVYRNGNAVRSHLVTVKSVPNPHREHSRFAVVVSKKVHKAAVGRNRMRRRIYEIVREDLPKMKSPHDVAIMVFSSELISLPSEELAALLRDVFQQSGLYK